MGRKLIPLLRVWLRLRITTLTDTAQYNAHPARLPALSDPLAQSEEKSPPEDDRPRSHRRFAVHSATGRICSARRPRRPRSLDVAHLHLRSQTAHHKGAERRGAGHGGIGPRSLGRGSAELRRSGTEAWPVQPVRKCSTCARQMVLSSRGREEDSHQRRRCHQCFPFHYRYEPNDHWFRLQFFRSRRYPFHCRLHLLSPNQTAP